MAKRNSARTQLREYFLANVGRKVTTQELRKVAGDISEYGRRIRELRSKDALNVQSHNDRSDLKVGEYILVDLKPLPKFERNISKETRAFVLDRNGQMCQMCGIGAGETHPYDGRRARLHIGHIIDKSMGGSDDPSNLRALCSVCNEGASNITIERPTHQKLLAQLKRAPATDQVKVLEFLINKFPMQSREQLETIKR